MRTGKKTRSKKRLNKSNNNRKKTGVSSKISAAHSQNETRTSTNLLQLIGKPFTVFLLWILKYLQHGVSLTHPKSELVWKDIQKWLKKFRHRLRKKQVRKAFKSLKKKTDQILIYQKNISRFPLFKKPTFVQWEQHLLAFYQKISPQLDRLASRVNQNKENIFQSATKELYTQLQLSKRDISKGINVLTNLQRVFIPAILFLFNQLLWGGKVFATYRHKAKKNFQNTYQRFRKLWLVRAIVKFFTDTEKVLSIPIYIRLRYVMVFVVVTSFISSGGAFYYYILKDLPDVSQLGSFRPSQTTKIYDRNGILLYKIFKNENRSLVPLEEIPDYMIQATIAVEDQNFYQHPGFSIRGISRAIKANLSDDNLQGGSTITQQLIKNTLLSPERTWERKVKELVLSFITEFYFSKDQILEMYLNQVAYGGSAYGVEEAAQMYFGKSIREVSLAEATFLAGMPVAPSKYSPYGLHPEFSTQRQAQVMRRMVEDGYIPSADAEIALAEELEILPPKTSLLAPHFVMYVKDALTDLYGSALVEQGGLEITTSLDLSVQNQAQKIVSEEVSRLQNLRVNNGAALVTNPTTGEVLAMVGSVDYYDRTHDGQVNVTLRERQPGSSIKPLMYSMALERGLTPASLIKDEPICYNIEGQPPYCPKNYDNTYHGSVTIRQALANSYNIPAVKTLAQYSVNDFIDHAEDLGISTWEERNRFGLALTLGGGEVKMIDMAVAYGVFANQGIKMPLRPILEVKNSEGEILATNPCVTPGHCRSGQVIDPRVAYQITDILKDNQARSQAFGTNSVLHIPGQELAVKTGTTNSLRDNWTIGYANDFLVAVWVGNNDNTPMSYIASGITGASPIWNKITTTMLAQSKEPHVFQPPTNLAKVQICRITGQLACNGCPSREEYFIPGTEPKSHCSPEGIANILNPRGPED